MSHLCGAHKANKGGNIRNGQCTAYFFQQKKPKKNQTAMKTVGEGTKKHPS